MSFKKYDGSVWQSINPKKLKGSPYTGTLPATLTGTKAGYLHRYKIYGNTEQTGTPTPENPIYPSECGERTANLFDKTDSSKIYNAYFTGAGYWKIDSGSYSVKILCAANTQYTLSVPSELPIFRIYESNNAEVIPANDTTVLLSEILRGENIKTYTFTTRNDTACIVFQGTGSLYQTWINGLIFNLGSTAPTSYIPYGYKLPLLSGSTPVDIYLGESQTTRRVKKIKARDITWNDGTSTGYSFYRGTLSIAKIAGIGTDTLISIKYKSSTTRNNMNDCEIASYNATTTLDIVVRDDRYSSASDWLLANGDTDIYYVLDTPETAVVNEPLRKIGDYADTIDSTQTSAQIPTAANSTTISWAGQGLAPSEFDSIQEWVDIPTYTYTNGEWVADN